MLKILMKYDYLYLSMSFSSLSESLSFLDFVLKWKNCAWNLYILTDWYVFFLCYLISHFFFYIDLCFWSILKIRINNQSLNIKLAWNFYLKINKTQIIDQSQYVLQLNFQNLQCFPFCRRSQASIKMFFKSSMRWRFIYKGQILEKWYNSLHNLITCKGILTKKLTLHQRFQILIQ